MPLDRPLRKAACAKYIYSDDDDDDGDFIEPAGPLPAPPLSTPRSSHTRKRPSNHIRRPRNAFIIFRSQFCQEQKMNETGVESDHRQISRIAAHVWNNLPDEEKARYRLLADQEKEIHKEAYPDYRYAPAGRPRVAIKHKEKRDDTEDTTRCRKIANLLLCGFQGRAFVEAAKKLARPNPDSRRTSRPSRGKRKNLPPDTKSHPSAPVELDPPVKVKEVVTTPGSDAVPFISPSPSPSPSLPTPSPVGTTASLVSPVEAFQEAMELSSFDLLREYDEEMLDSHFSPSVNMMLSHLNSSKPVSVPDGIPDWVTSWIPERNCATFPFSEPSATTLAEHFSKFVPGETGVSECDMDFDYSVDFSDYLLDTVV